MSTSSIVQYLLPLLCTGIFIGSDALAAYWGKGGSIWLTMPLLILLSPLGYILFGVLNQQNTLAQSSVYVNMGLLIGTVAIGVLAFHEPVTLRLFLALIFALAAIILSNF